MSQADSALSVFDALDVERRLPISECIDLMEQVQRDISTGVISLPLRQAMPLPGGENRHLLMMPGALTEPPVFGAKLLSLFPDNSQSSPPAPVIQGQVLLFDGRDGRAIAAMDAAPLTAIRTAAASAAATRALANPDASTLTLLGYGVQAASHLKAICAVRPIREVLVWGPDKERAEAFVSTHKAPSLQPRLQVATNAEHAIRQADVVCAVSATTTPIIEGRWLQPGCHVNLVGAHSPDSREADGATLARARVFTEVTEFALAEAGDLILAVDEGLLQADQIAGEIGAVFAGRLSGREDPTQITLYKSLGNTAQDLAAAYHVLANA